MNILLAIILGYLIGKYWRKKKEVNKPEYKKALNKRMTEEEILSRFDDLQSMLDNAIIEIDDMKEGL